MSNTSSEHIEEVIANGRRIVAEAEAALAASERFFAEHNISPEAMLEEVRRTGGDAAVAAVEAEVAEAIRQVQEDVQRMRLHAATPRPMTKRPRMSRQMI